MLRVPQLEHIRVLTIGVKRGTKLQGDSVEELDTWLDSCFKTIILADLWQVNCKRTSVASEKQVELLD